MPDSGSNNSENKNKGFDVQTSFIINGHHTEFVFQPFANRRWFLLITQLGKISNFFTVQFDLPQDQAVDRRIAVDDPEFHQSIPVTMTCNFGADKDETRSAIQFLVNKTNLGKCPTDFVISLGLKETNATTLRALAKALNEIIL